MLQSYALGSSYDAEKDEDFQPKGPTAGKLQLRLTFHPVEHSPQEQKEPPPAHQQPQQHHHHHQQGGATAEALGATQREATAAPQQAPPPAPAPPRRAPGGSPSLDPGPPAGAAAAAAGQGQGQGSSSAAAAGSAGSAEGPADVIAALVDSALAPGVHPLSLAPSLWPCSGVLAVRVAHTKLDYDAGAVMLRFFFFLF